MSPRDLASHTRARHKPARKTTNTVLVVAVFKPDEASAWTQALRFLCRHTKLKQPLFRQNEFLELSPAIANIVTDGRARVVEILLEAVAPLPPGTTSEMERNAEGTEIPFLLLLFLYGILILSPRPEGYKGLIADIIKQRLVLLYNGDIKNSTRRPMPSTRLDTSRAKATVRHSPRHQHHHQR